MLDDRLDLHIVPRTELVALSSPVSLHGLSAFRNPDVLTTGTGVLLRLPRQEEL